MPSLGNGQCAHQWVGAGRCLELAVTTRPWKLRRDLWYKVPLCASHAEFHDDVQAAAAKRNPIVGLFELIKNVEQDDGSWPGGDVVEVVSVWFIANGIDPEEPYATVAQRFGINTKE